jgi:hypothetical protein
LPETSNFSVGLVVPIPTLPLELIYKDEELPDIISKGRGVLLLFAVREYILFDAESTDISIPALGLETELSKAI